jgi:DNA invertase Pin-like site-specific DNA recombinase
MATRKRNAMLIGYARVSKIDQQDTRAQVKALKEAGCKRIFEESASGGRWDRPQLHQALDQLRDGDLFVVWKLDRLSRSLKDLLTILERITEAGAGFRSLTENVDTTTSAGRMLMQMLGAFAEFERSMVRERTRLGLQAARERGRIGGRQPKLTPHQRDEAIKMVSRGEKSAADVARLFGVHRSSISRLLSITRS